jgi:hypothetical protein
MLQDGACSMLELMYYSSKQSKASTKPVTCLVNFLPFCFGVSAELPWMESFTAANDET